MTEVKTLRKKISSYGMKNYNKGGFPLVVLPPFFQDLIINISQTMNFSPDALACAVLSLAGTTAGNNVKFRIKHGWQTPALFWFAIVGETGTGKTWPLDLVLKPLHGIDRENFIKFEADMKEYKKQIRRQQKAKGKPEYDGEFEQEPDKPFYEQIIVEDVTVEGLVPVLKHNGIRALYHLDELDSFWSAQNQYKGGKGTDEQFWLRSFNNTSYSKNRKSDDPVRIDNIFIPIIGGIQPSVIFEVIQSSKNNGMKERYLFTPTMTNATAASLDDPDPDMIQKLHDLVEAAVDKFSKERLVLEISLQVKKLWKKYEDHYTKQANKETTTQTMKGYYSKIKTYMPRFALVLAILRHMEDLQKLDVLEEDYHNAKKIADYFVSTAEKLFQGSDDDFNMNSYYETIKHKTPKEQAQLLYQRDVQIPDIIRLTKISRSAINRHLGKGT